MNGNLQGVKPRIPYFLAVPSSDSLVYSPDSRLVATDWGNPGTPEHYFPQTVVSLKLCRVISLSSLTERVES